MKTLVKFINNSIRLAQNAVQNTVNQSDGMYKRLGFNTLKMTKITNFIVSGTTGGIQIEFEVREAFDPKQIGDIWCQMIVKDLQKNKIIHGFSGVVNPSSLDGFVQDKLHFPVLTLSLLLREETSWAKLIRRELDILVSEIRRLVELRNRKKRKYDINQVQKRIDIILKKIKELPKNSDLHVEAELISLLE